MGTITSLFKFGMVSGSPKVTFTGTGAVANTAGTTDYPLKSPLAGYRPIDLQYNCAAASGSSRLIYARTVGTVANSGGFESVRAYSLAKAAVSQMHGLHGTAEISTAGSITGEACGVRATIATITGLTLNTGHYMAIRLDSDLTSVLTGVPAAAFIGVYDVGAQHMPNFLYIDSSASSIKTGTTASTAAGCLKVNDGGTVKYIQLFTTAT
jgi:hypothetical protein